MELQKALEPLGYSCLACNSEKDLKDLIVTHHHNIGLIVIDEKVGNIPGYCRTIKGNELLRCYVLVLASRNSNLTEHEVLDSGADLFVVKPIKAPILVKRINALLLRK